MDIKEVKQAMAEQRPVFFQGGRYTILEYRLKLCRNNQTMKNSGTFYHTLLLKDAKADSTAEVLLGDVETELHTTKE